MDSWEQEVPEESLSQLNINATEFVPGRNIHAVEFVPGGVKPSQPSPPESTVNTDANSGSSNENTSTNASSRAEALEPEPMIHDEEEEEEEEEELIEQEKRRSRQATENDVKKETINLVFIGHVDAGKSTIGGHLLHLTGMVDQRTLEKFEREAKERNRETWYLSYALDTNVEERVKGKTVECGRGYFETETKHFVLLDAPGHKSFVPNMISGAAQADLAILVISARRGEFETGFEKGGQTREHAMLVKTAGVKHLIVLINKMDDPTVDWQGERYNECKEKLLPYLKRVGFNPKTDIFFMPCSGLTGAGLKDPVDSSLAPWYTGPSLLSYLENLPQLSRPNQGPLRLPIAERYKDMGTIICGKVETGSLSKGHQLVVMPNKVNVEVLQIVSDDLEVDYAQAGDNVKVKLKNIEEEDISNGFVLCAGENLCKTGYKFDAQFVVLEHKSIICPGYTAVMHLHCCVEEVTLSALICTIDRKTNAKKQIKPRFIKQDDAAIGRFVVNGGAVCMETFKDFQQMGRFTLRDEGKTIAIGKILKIVQATSTATPE